jgi:hypothetical protein
MWYVDYNIDKDEYGDDCIICPTWEDVLRVLKRNPDYGCDIRYFENTNEVPGGE